MLAHCKIVDVSVCASQAAARKAQPLWQQLGFQAKINERKKSNSNEDFVLECLRFKEHGIEQDVPVCEMVTQRKCNGVLGERRNILSEI